MTYPGTLSLSRAYLTHLADLLRGHRTRIGSRWRKLTPGRPAMLVLAHLRNSDAHTRLAAGFEVGLATVYRYVHEAATRGAVYVRVEWLGERPFDDAVVEEREPRLDAGPHG